ncbi:unknown [Firmicutes bacterium CAG:555]|nr:unknown [Firmicutes bacterium CAG:555]
MDENFTVGRRHENADESADTRRCHQHHFRPAAHLRPARPAGNGHRRCSGRNRCRADSSSAGRDEKGLSPLAGQGTVCAPHKENFPPRHAEYTHAVGIHLLYIRPQTHPLDLLRRGGHDAGTLLQVADILLHPLGRNADLHRAGDKLQLCRTQDRPLPQDTVDLCAVRHGADGTGDAVLRASSRADAAGVHIRRARRRNRACGLSHYRRELPAACDLAHFPRVLPSDRHEPQELGADRRSHGGALCPAGLCVLTLRARLVLADLPRDRHRHEHRGLRVLSPVPAQGLCR